MEYSIYIYEADEEALKNEKLKKELVREAVGTYCLANGIDFPKDIEISYGHKGKPYYKGIPVHFSVSHTAGMWICMIGKAPCGIDIQIAKECNYDKIAERHFTEGEKKFIERFGIEGFYRIWTHREAFGKYTGEGFYGKMPAFADEEGNLVDMVCALEEKDKPAYIIDVPIASDIICAYCTGGESDEIKFFG